jgi:hypothetical protein
MKSRDIIRRLYDLCVITSKFSSQVNDTFFFFVKDFDFKRFRIDENRIESKTQ